MEKRQLKFRAWYEKDKQMIDWFTLTQNAWNTFRGETPLSLIYEIFVARKEDFNVMQSIGVKGYVGDYENRHKNEVDLYEGDIVEAGSEGSKGVFQIVYRAEGSPIWLLYPNWQERKHWNIHGSDLGREKGDYFDALKVIGNIYENPELLQ